MPHPYVTSASIKDNMIELDVELDASDAGTYVEVFGSATQVGGAFANFYNIQQVPTAPNDTDPNSTDRHVFVSAHPIPPNQFREDQDVTVVIRVGKVWVTVLGKDSTPGPSTSGPTARDGTTWNTVREVSEITDGSPDQTDTSYQ